MNKDKIIGIILDQLNLKSYKSSDGPIRLDEYRFKYIAEKSAEEIHKEYQKQWISVDDIRNKLGPVYSLLTLLKDTRVIFDPMFEQIINDHIHHSFKSLSYLCKRDDLTPEPLKESEE